MRYYGNVAEGKLLVERKSLLACDDLHENDVGFILSSRLIQA